MIKTATKKGLTLSHKINMKGRGTETRTCQNLELNFKGTAGQKKENETPLFISIQIIVQK